MPVPPSKAIHTGCYQVTVARKEITRGKNIRDAKLKAIAYFKNLIPPPEIKIYFLQSYGDPIEVDNDLSIYQNAT